MKHFLYHIIGEVILISLLIFSTICLYHQSQIISKQREFINELQFEYYKLEEYKEAIRVANIIFDNNNIWDNSRSRNSIVHDPDCPCYLDTLSIYVVNNNDTTYVIKNRKRKD